MKFFSELGSCYRSSHQDKEERGDHAPPLPSTDHHAQRNNNSSGCSASASSSSHRHWRPGLQAIREDGVVLGSELGKITERKAQSINKSKGRYTSKSHRVSHNDYSFSTSRNCNNSAPIIIPAFSPTPFLF